MKNSTIKRFEEARHDPSIIAMMRKISVPRPKDKHKDRAPHLKPRTVRTSLDEPWCNQDMEEEVEMEHQEFEGDEFMCY